MFDWITNVIEQTGYLGIALLMLAENIFPPIPSEVIMPLAGFTAARGDLNIFLVIAAGAAGSLVGALGWYYVGRLVSPDRIKALASRHGRWMAIHPGEVNRASEWLDRYGRLSVFIGRLVPTISTLISIPAGIIRMPLRTFYSTPRLVRRRGQRCSPRQAICCKMATNRSPPGWIRLPWLSSPW